MRLRVDDLEKVFRSWDVEETWLLPPSVREPVPEGHLAHVIRDIVCELDLSAICNLAGKKSLFAVSCGQDSLRIRSTRAVEAVEIEVEPCRRHVSASGYFTD